MHVFKCAACLLLDLPFYWFGMRNPSGTVPAFTFLSARVLPHPLVLPRPCQCYTRSHWWPSRRFSSIEPFVSTVCGIYRWQVPLLGGPSPRRFLDGLVHRPFTLGHRVGVVNPRQFRGFNRPALAAGIAHRGLSALAARRLDDQHPSEPRGACQAGRLSA